MELHYGNEKASPKKGDIMSIEMKQTVKDLHKKLEELKGCL